MAFLIVLSFYPFGDDGIVQRLNAINTKEETLPQCGEVEVKIDQ